MKSPRLGISSVTAAATLSPRLGRLGDSVETTISRSNDVCPAGLATCVPDVSTTEVGLLNGRHQAGILRRIATGFASSCRPGDSDRTGRYLVGSKDRVCAPLQVGFPTLSTPIMMGDVTE